MTRAHQRPFPDYRIRCALVVALLPLLTIPAGASPAPPAVSSRVRVPLWSPRRFPEALGRFVAQLRLDASLDAALRGTNSCLVAKTGGTTIVDRAPTASLAGASNDKLLTAAAALSVLGPEFRFVTRLVARAAPRAGVVDEAWLVGAGDPMLATPDYQAFLATQPFDHDRHVTPLSDLADALAGAGVRALGTVHGDDSRYSRERFVPTWKPEYLKDHEAGPLGALMVNDGFTSFRPERFAPDPAATAADQLRKVAASRGLTLSGTADNATAPRGAVTIATATSAPLSVVVADMLAESDNNAAELLTRELGARVAHDGSTPAGVSVVRGELARLAIPLGGVQLVDGSGLDTGNRVTCAALIAALELGNRSRYAVLQSGLAVAAQTGTLSKRLADTSLAGRLRAKTGSIDGVVALTGFIDSPGRLSFALVADGSFSDAGGRAIQDGVAAALARWPDAPDPSSLAP